MDDTSVQVCFWSFFEVWRPVIQMDSFLCVLFKFFVRLKHSLIKLERENFWIRNLSTKKKWPRFLHDWVCIYEELFVIRDFIPIWNHQSTLLKNLSSIARSIYLLRKNWKMGKNKLELSWCKTNYHTKIENWSNKWELRMIMDCCI